MLKNKMMSYTFEEAKQLMRDYYSIALFEKAYPETYKKETYNIIRAMKRAGASDKTLEALKAYRRKLVKSYIEK